MDIRSVTLFVNPDQDPLVLQPFLSAAREAFSFPVQTIRLATTPFPDWHEPQQFAARWANLVDS